VDLTKTRKGPDEASTEQQRTHSRNRLTINKYLEVAFWGTIFWGIARLAIHFFHFTPYGLSTFARPFIGTAGVKAYVGVVVGAMVLFIFSLLASFVYVLLFSKSRIWWNGLLFGLILMLVTGYFFRGGKWELSILSTEAAWFLSYGLFIGMTLNYHQTEH
jgi:Conserved membrane protein YqhR